MDWTEIGAPPPMVTGPIWTGIDFLLVTSSGKVMNLTHHLCGHGHHLSAQWPRRQPAGGDKILWEEKM
jgi:hypothetical protein